METAEQNKTFDVIVIGAGIGGLFAAAKLAKEGKNVLVLEQHSIPGGYATTFRRNGYMFEAGIHAIDGFFSADNPNLKLFREIGILDNIHFLRLPEFYSVKRGDFSVTIHDIMEGFGKELDISFPDHKKQTQTFIKVLTKLRNEIIKFPVDRKKMLLSLPLAPFKFPLILKNLFNTLGKFMDKLTDNDDLKIALTANTGYYHTDPYSYSLLHFGGAQGSYLTGGAAYIQGGSRKLTGYLVKYIRNRGSTVLFNHRVKDILVENTQVLGVTCKSEKLPSETFRAKYIVANAAIPTVINSMLPERTARKLKKKLCNYTISHSVFCLYFGLKKPLREIGHNNYSTFILPDELTKFKHMAKFNTTDDFSKKILALVDYSFIDAQLTKDNRATATCAVIDEIDLWEDLDQDAYNKRKEECCQKIITRLEESYPGFRNNIDYYEGATPKTMKRYTENPRGCIYGYEQCPNQIGPKRPDQYSGITGLYFASAWSKPGGGITAAAKCGNTAAKEILNKFK